METTWKAVHAYFAAHLGMSDPLLEAVLQTNAQEQLPPMDVAPNQGKLLYLLARMQGAKRILEIGTLGGYSSVWLGRALPPDGRLVTLELDPRHAAVARRNHNVVRDGKVVDADSSDPRVQGVRQLADFLSREPRIEATAIQTAGVKGYDGFLLALVKEAGEAP